MKELSAVLWGEYGIDVDAEDSVDRETSGIKLIAIMYDDGVAAFGFKGRPDKLLKWMATNGFRAKDCNLQLFE